MATVLSAADPEAENSPYQWRLRGRQKADAALTRHGSTLYTLAHVLAGDREHAEQLVLQAIFTGRAGGVTRNPADPQDGLRRLARLIYLQWCADVGPKSVPAASAPQPGALAGPTLLLGLKAMPHEQRAAVALCMFGGHSYRQAAEVLVLPAEAVAELLRDALYELDLAVETDEVLNAGAPGTGRRTAAGDYL